MSNLLYGALMLGRNRGVAKEEYLVAQQKKEPAAFRVKEEHIEIRDVMADASAVLHLEQTVPGYLEIEAFSRDSFIRFDRKVLIFDGTVGEEQEFSLAIAADQLHNGKNFGSLIFRTSNQEIVVPIVVNNKILTKLEGRNPKRIFAELEENYLKLRLGELTPEEWIDGGLKALETVDGDDAKSLFLLLYKAHLDINSERFEEARNLIEFVAARIEITPSADANLAGYFTYVRSLYELDDDGTARALQTVREAFGSRPSWQLLWILFYLDPRYEEDRGVKLNEISTLFYEQHCCSPVMYYEALECFLGRPQFVTEATEFELQVLSFGIRHGRFSAGLADRLAEILLDMGEISLSGKNLQMAIRILKYARDTYHGVMVLKALCTLLIFTENRDSAYHDYFVQAIQEFLTIPGMYNYFIFTIDDTKMDPLPEEILSYFGKNSETFFDWQNYLYANIVANKEANPEAYRIFRRDILYYAGVQIRQGKCDRFLAVIYQDILDTDQLSRDMQANLFEIICTKEIICKNTRMRSALIFHEELNVYQETTLENGRASAKIYSPDALILFKDYAGNIYYHVTYEVRDLVKTGEYIDLCIRGVPINRFMLLKSTLPLLKVYKNPVDILKFMVSELGQGHLRGEYEQKLIRDTVFYYSRDCKDEQILDQLLNFLEFPIDEETRGRLIEVMIELTMYRNAFDEIGDHGFAGISPDCLCKLCHVLAELSDYEENELLLTLCVESFRKAGFDPEVFEYLNRHFDGDMDLLLELYRSANAYGMNWRETGEKILRLCVAGNVNPDAASQIFERYSEEPDGDWELRKEYLVFRAGRYLFGEDRLDTGFFKQLETDLLVGTLFDSEVLTAYLLYASGQPLSDKQARLAGDILDELCRRSIMLEDFKELGKYTKLPAALKNAHIAGLLDRSPAGPPQITYEISGGRNGSFTEPLTEVFPGGYVKYFNLFEGERLTYSVQPGRSITVSYTDLDPEADGSRYARLNHLIRLQQTGSTEEWNKEAKEYYVRDRLIDRLF